MPLFLTAAPQSEASVDNAIAGVADLENALARRLRPASVCRAPLLSMQCDACRPPFLLSLFDGNPCFRHSSSCNNYSVSLSLVKVGPTCTYRVTAGIWPEGIWDEIIFSFISLLSLVVGGGGIVSECVVVQ